ncbi:MAG: hypothetical protein JWM71_642 [Solirubrobacteraceae bacterium]|nr:hypothetical protein [Solirubrobacteraceae bacterium]
MTHDDQATDGVHDTEDRPADDVGRGVTNKPRGTGDRDEDAISAGEDRLEQATGGH